MEQVNVLASVRGLVKKLGHIDALAGVDLQVSAGEVVGLIGPNGAGKTTLIKCLARLVRPDAGIVDLLSTRPGRAASFVYEVDALPSDMAVEAFLRCEALARGADATAIAAAMADTGIGALRRRAIGNLSLGNRRRVALAAALLPDADLLVMDEPTNGLDIEGLQMVRTLIADRKAAGRSVLFSSHTMSEVERVADRVVVIDRGRVLFEGPVGVLMASTGAARLESAYEAVLLRGVER